MKGAYKLFFHCWNNYEGDLIAGCIVRILGYLSKANLKTRANQFDFFSRRPYELVQSATDRSLLKPKELVSK